MKVELQITQSGNGSKLFIDGKELECLRSVKVRAKINTISTVVLEIIPHEIIISGDNTCDYMRFKPKGAFALWRGKFKGVWCRIRRCFWNIHGVANNMTDTEGKNG